MKPWKLAEQYPGECDVVERATGERIGYLRQDYFGNWAAYLTAAAGWQLPFGWRPLTASEREVWGGAKRRPILRTRYRHDAAARVWRAWIEGR